MNNQILISDFVKLTGSTLKTVLYYHKIGVLKEPKRSESGYRLYGAEELAQMRMIKHLKHLGLDLSQIKEILGDSKNNKSLRAVLKSLQSELIIEKNKIEDQLSKIEILLEEETEDLERTSFESKSFKMITKILDSDQVKSYKEDCPDLFNQQRNIFGVMDDFKWDKDYQQNFGKLAEYFKENPKQYKIALEFGKRLAKLKHMSEYDPEIENLAREGAEFIKKEPFLKDMLYGQHGFDDTNENLFNDISNKYLSPAQIKHKKLIQKYLNYRP